MAAMRFPRFQFHLRTLFVGVAMLATACYLAMQIKIVKGRIAALAALRALARESPGGPFTDADFTRLKVSRSSAVPRFWFKKADLLSEGDPKADPGWLRRVLGDEDIYCIVLWRPFSDAAAAQFANEFPEASIWRWTD